MDPGNDSSETRALGDPVAEKTLSDPRAIRALAHPVRLDLIGLLAHAGTLTATQAGAVLGQSPANCAFHLRTLAKYGLVEEAGGGRGRERPWRRTHVMIRIRGASAHGGPSAANRALDDVLYAAAFGRFRATMAARESWPDGMRETLHQSTVTLSYLTPAEATELSEEMQALLFRHFDRVDHPELRPKDAVPVEILAFAYPLLELLDVPVSEPLADQPDLPEGS